MENPPNLQFVRVGFVKSKAVEINLSCCFPKKRILSLSDLRVDLDNKVNVFALTMTLYLHTQILNSSHCNQQEKIFHPLLKWSALHYTVCQRRAVVISPGIRI